MSYLSVYGHIILDTLIESPKTPQNEEFTGIKDYHVRYGGTGANIATAAARLGVPVGLNAFVGEDFPEDYRDFLTESAVDISGVESVKGKSSRVWIINTPEGQRGFVFQGVMGEMERYERVYPAADTEWVHISTGRPEYNLDIAKWSRKKDMNLSFDPGQEIHYVYDPESLRSMLSFSHIFFCNESELQRALSMLELKHAGELLDMVPMVINTLGERGSRIIREGSEEEIPPIPADVVDPTGAGDTYRAGFYSALYRGLGYYDAALFASAAASIVIEGYGAQEPAPRMDEVIKRLNKAGYGGTVP